MTLLPSCAPFDEQLGESVRTNAELQIINPQPTYAGNVIEGGSGTQAAAAAKRYRTDTIKPLETIHTSHFDTGNGSNGGTGSGAAVGAGSSGN
jgi:hypothetical protein